MSNTTDEIERLNDANNALIEIGHKQADEIERLTAKLNAIQSVVNEQAENEGLWFRAEYATEAYLQSELRRLHEVIDGKTGDEIARELMPVSGYTIELFK